MSDPTVPVSTAVAVNVIGASATVAVWHIWPLLGAIMLVLGGALGGAFAAVWEVTKPRLGATWPAIGSRMVPGSIIGVPLSWWTSDHFGISVWFLFAAVACAISWRGPEFADALASFLQREKKEKEKD